MSGETPAGQGSGGDEGAQGPFTHEDLKDKDPAEVERLYDMMKNTVREQGARLNEQARQSQQRDSEGRPSQEPSSSEGSQSEFTADDFWSDPVGTMRGLVKTEMNETVAPLRERIEGGNTQDAPGGGQLFGEAARESLRNEIPDFRANEPWIDQLLHQLGIPVGQATVETLRMVNYTARGMRQDQQGSPQQGSPSQNQPAQQGQQMNQPNQQQGQQPAQQQQGRQQGAPQQQGNPPPQQRPSSAPLPRNQSGQETTRSLTENEKRMAREFGFVDGNGNIDVEEFIRWQDMSPEEVVTAER